MALLLSWNFPVGVKALAGDLDPAFGTDGKVITKAFGNGTITAMAVQPDSKLIAAGTIQSQDFDFSVIRYQADGSLDSTFGAGGMVSSDFSGGTDISWAVALQSDGKIVVAGFALNGSLNFDFGLIRYNQDGTLDLSFGAGGKVLTDFYGSSDRCFALAIQPDGKILAAGHAMSTSFHTDFALARYNRDGSLDSTFGVGGKVTTDFFGSNDEARALALLPDNRIVVAGSTPLRNGDNCLFGLSCYLADGSLDLAFGTNGKTTTDLFGIFNEAYTLQVTAEGRFVVGGSAQLYPNIPGAFALARYTADGNLDHSFGTNGRITTDFTGGSKAYAMAIQPDGKIILTGAIGTADFALARYNADGSPDTSFGVGGRVTTDLLGSDDIAYALALMPNGRIVTGGFASKPNGTSYEHFFALACYQNDLETAPQIARAEIIGKKLYIFGANFDQGAKLFMNGEKQKKTFNDELNPTIMLIASKSAKWILPGETVTLLVHNSDGKVSNEFRFTRPVP
jgi:uncharacterized delta-60 repeat protein